jgi:hypothetical protein
MLLSLQMEFYLQRYIRASVLHYSINNLVLPHASIDTGLHVTSHASPSQMVPTELILVSRAQQITAETSLVPMDEIGQ